MKEQLLALIDRHNVVVSTLEQVSAKVKVDGWLFKGMELWHNLACEGSDITHIARENGIDAKCNMQTGRIIVYGNSAAE